MPRRITRKVRREKKKKLARVIRRLSCGNMEKGEKRDITKGRGGRDDYASIVCVMYAVCNSILDWDEVANNVSSFKIFYKKYCVYKWNHDYY